MKHGRAQSHAGVSRRCLFRSAAGGIAGAALLAGTRRWAAAARTGDPRPSILLCIGDDWGWPHARALGDRVVRTPNFDRVAREGVLFPHAYCASPSCTPSRAAILTGQMFYRLEHSANLWSTLDRKFRVYPQLLEEAGYHIGLYRKGWGPGDFRAGGWTQNPAGPAFRNFEDFLRSVPDGKPFCFWWGTNDPHRAYDRGSGAAAGLKASDVQLPPYFPDAPEVRNDVLDYYFEVERADREIGQLLKLLEDAGRLDNTIVVITGDNGWPFPRGKTNLYDMGARQPLAVRWPAGARGGRVVEDFVSLCDLAPTFLEAAGLKPLPEMTARSFLDVLSGGKSGRVDPARDRVVIGRERHVGGTARAGGTGYPMRCLRTHRYKYIRNFCPDRWPVGDPPRYADCDDGPTKTYMLQNAADPKISPMVELCFGKRPAEELYDMVNDPWETRNLAADESMADVKRQLAGDLEAYLRKTGDPRVVGGAEKFDEYPYRNPARPPATRPAL